MKKTIALLMALCMLLTVLAGCKKSDNDPGTAAPTETAPTETTTTTSEPADTTATPEPEPDDPNETGVLNLQWHAAIGTDERFENPLHDMQCLYHMMVYDALLAIDTSDGSFIPKLASSFSFSPDGSTYTFTIRDGVTWHDGTPFTIDDVVFSIIASGFVPGSTTAGVCWSLEGVTEYAEGEADSISGISVNGNVLTLTLAVPINNYLAAITNLRILPKHAFEGVSWEEFSISDFFTKPIGTGSYYIDEVSFPNYFTVLRNDNYWGEKAGIRKVVYTSYATGGDEAAITSMIAGNLDFVYGNAFNDINTATNISRQNSDISYIMYPSNYFRAMQYATGGQGDGEINEDILNPNVRKALAMLIDKDAICSMYANQAVPLTTFVSPAHPAYNTDIPLYVRDVAKARQILEDEGFDFTKTWRLLYYYTDQTTLDVMEIIVQNYAEAGVKIQPILAEGDMMAVFYGLRNYEICYYGGYQSDPIYNMVMYIPGNAPETDDLVMAQLEERQPIADIYNIYNVTFDPVEMKKVGDELQAVFLDLCFGFPVYSLSKIAIYNSAHVNIPLEIFGGDYEKSWDMRFHEWSLNY